MNDSNNLPRFTVFGQSDVGLVRQNNEDNFLIVDLTTGVSSQNSVPLDEVVGENGNLLIVADGMGGGEAGEVASRMAVDAVAENLLTVLRSSPNPDPKDFVRYLKGAIEEANRKIFYEGQRDRKFRGMGTTLTVAAVHGTTVYFAQLGDSRAYLIRNGCIVQMTQDQSLVAQLVESGSITPEEAKGHPKRNVILQALGTEAEVNVVMSYDSLRRRDRIVLCSDGLSGKVDAEEINEVVHKWSTPKDACQRLIELARERGGEDNITVVVAHFDGEALPDPDTTQTPSYTVLKGESRRSFWPWGWRQ